MHINLCIDETNNPDIINVIKKGVFEFNKPYFGSYQSKVITIYAQNEDARVIGGIVGNTLDKYLRVDWVWVDEAYRSQGIGTGLFKVLEKFAYEHHFQFIQLDTFDFQARPFYEKLGFQCVGTIPKWLDGRDCHFMRKTL